jgi:orotidine-5'-phosphate decarboxylase
MDIVKLLNLLRNKVSGVKIGWPTILSLGEEGVYRLLNEYDWPTFFIADIKLADVGHVNRILVQHIADMGFDALIAHSFVGGSSALEDVVEEAMEYGLGVLSLVAMSHPGGEEVLNRNFEYLLNLSMRLDVDGIIVPATMPKYISSAREMGFENLIFCPGVGYQGAVPGSAVESGADFEIIGRLIYRDEHPDRIVNRLLESLRW